MFSRLEFIRVRNTEWEIEDNLRLRRVKYTILYDISERRPAVEASVQEFIDSHAGFKVSSELREKMIEMGCLLEKNSNVRLYKKEIDFVLQICRLNHILDLSEDALVISMRKRRANLIEKALAREMGAKVVMSAWGKRELRNIRLIAELTPEPLDAAIVYQCAQIGMAIMEKTIKFQSIGESILSQRLDATYEFVQRNASTIFGIPDKPEYCWFRQINLISVLIKPVEEIKVYSSKFAVACHEHDGFKFLAYLNDLIELYNDGGIHFDLPFIYEAWAQSIAFRAEKHARGLTFEEVVDICFKPMYLAGKQMTYASFRDSMDGYITYHDLMLGHEKEIGVFFKLNSCEFFAEPGPEVAEEPRGRKQSLDDEPLDNLLEYIEGPKKTPAKSPIKKKKSKAKKSKASLRTLKSRSEQSLDSNKITDEITDEITDDVAQIIKRDYNRQNLAYAITSLEMAIANCKKIDATHGLLAKSRLHIAELKTLEALNVEDSSVLGQVAQLCKTGEEYLVKLREAPKKIKKKKNKFSEFDDALDLLLRETVLVEGKRSGGKVNFLFDQKDTHDLWTYVKARYSNRWLSHVKKIKSKGEWKYINQNFALAYYVTSKSLSGFSFDVSVHIWRRIEGKSGLPSQKPWPNNFMNGNSWRDTLRPCCVLHVGKRIETLSEGSSSKV